MAQALILWDIDGTLLSTGGSGRAALDLAFEELFGVPEAFREVSFGGRTDNGILGEAFERAGLVFEADHEPLVRSRYLVHLRRLLAERGPLVRLCPGVTESLHALDALATHALLTGNWRQGAQEKLQAVGLWERFGFGAFADDSPRRDDLVPVARRRAAERGLHAEHVVVIGDTIHDVSCARAGDAIAVAVCTGWSSREELERSAPDLLITDLEQGLGSLHALISSLG